MEPSPLANWDAPIERAAIAAFDLEMTGLDPERDEIIELAAVVSRGGDAPVAHASVLVTTCEVSASAAELHGISRQESEQGVAPAVGLAAFLDAIEGCVLVGHGVELDLEFLRRATERWLPHRAPPTRVIDTLTLARRAVHAKRYSLEALCDELRLPKQRFHRATGDALATRALFAALCPIFAAESAGDLWEVRVGQDREVSVRRSIARRIEALREAALPAGFVVRQGGRAPRTIRGVVERWEPPHARIRRANAPPILLRADRILRVEPAD